MAAAILVVMAAGVLSVFSAMGKTDFMNFVGVCRFPEQPEGWAVVWHTEVPGIDRAVSDRVFKYLEGPDFDGCLRHLIETDPKAHAAVRALVGATKDEPFEIAYKRVKKRWKKFGVDKAIQEIVETGHRGERVESVLKACDALKASAEPSRK